MQTSLSCPIGDISGRKKLTPFGQGNIAETFVSGSVFDIALMIEVVVDARSDRGEFQQATHLSESEFARCLRLNGKCEFSALLFAVYNHEYLAEVRFPLRDLTSSCKAFLLDLRRKLRAEFTTPMPDALITAKRMISGDV